MVKIDGMVTTHVTPVDKSTIIFTERTRDWCKLPYPTRDENGVKFKDKDKRKITYPNGCADNYNNCDTCPPRTPYRADILEMYKYFVLIHATFDIPTYVERNREIHPDWSNKQLRNSRHWQGQLRRILKDRIIDEGFKYDELFGAGKNFMGRPSMEGSGIFVFATFQRNGIKFDKRARKFVKMACLLVSNSPMIGDKTRKKKKTRLDDFIRRSRVNSTSPARSGLAHFSRNSK